MSQPPNLRDPFGVFLRACFLDYKQHLADDKISERLWIEKVEEWHTAWHNFRKPAKRKKRGALLTDEEWVASLKADPFLQGVAVDTEIAKCQFHFRNMPHPVEPSRKRILNWLKNADRVVVQKAPPPASLEPAGWLAWMRTNRPDWRRFTEERSGFPVPAWERLPTGEQELIRQQMSQP